MTNNSYIKPSAQITTTSSLPQPLQQNYCNHHRMAAYPLYLLATCLIQLIGAESALAAAAATLDFDAGITAGVNPITKLILTHNGTAIFLSSAMGMLLGGGAGSDGWTRLKMGGLWAVGAAALIHIMKGTLGVQMPG